MGGVRRRVVKGEDERRIGLEREGNSERSWGESEAGGYKKYKILAFRNLYTYHTFMETFKILKLRYPISLYEQYNISRRKEITLITSHPSKDFVSRSTSLWNTIVPKLKLMDYSHNINQAKSCLKKSLLNMQHVNDDIAWLGSKMILTLKKCLLVIKSLLK